MAEEEEGLLDEGREGSEPAEEEAEEPEARGDRTAEVSEAYTQIIGPIEWGLILWAILTFSATRSYRATECECGNDELVLASEASQPIYAVLLMPFALTTLTNNSPHINAVLRALAILPVYLVVQVFLLGGLALDAGACAILLGCECGRRLSGSIVAISAAFVVLAAFAVALAFFIRRVGAFGGVVAFAWPFARPLPWLLGRYRNKISM